MIKNVSLRNLRLMTFAQVMKNVKTFLEKENLADLGLQEVKTQFDDAFTHLENSLQVARKSEQTETLLELDKERDTLLTGFVAHCKLFESFPDQAKQQAAKRAVIQINAYGKGIAYRSYREETSIIRNLLNDFAQSAFDADITLIGAKQWLTALQPLNEKFDQLHTQRTAEEAEKQVGQTREARTAMQAQFEHLCKAIEALAFVKGEAKFQNLVNAINLEVKGAVVNR